MAIRNHHKSSRDCRDGRHQPYNHYNHAYKYLVGILAVVFCAPVYAEGATSVAANPQASISGSVANQAVQINQGSLSTQSFSRGHYCNGAVLSFSPYILQSQSDPGATLSRNFGGQLTFSMPLDFSAVNTCKALAQKQLDKAKLDYELIRIKECINIYKTGFMIHPDSPYAAICKDIIVIPSVASSTDVREPKTVEAASSEEQPAS
jgi:hypothetical protein